jgi:uncharacterized protein (DUF58 family)
VSAITLLLLAVIVMVSAVVTGWRLLFHVGWLLLVVPAFGYLWTRLAFVGLSVLRHSPQTRVQLGEVLKERLGLRNASWFPKLWLEVHDGGDLPGRSSGSVLSLAPRSEKRWRQRTVCERRGRFLLGPLTISASDPFGLFRRAVQAGPRRELLVYPQILPLGDFGLPANELTGGNIAQRRAFQSTPTVATVREYQPGDPLNRVSWKATARHNQLMVKEFDLDPVADAWIVLDLDRRLHATSATPDRAFGPDPAHRYLNSTVEYAVTCAASIASSLLERGRSVGLLTWSGHGQVIPPEQGPEQLWRILEALAVAEPNNTPPLREVLATHQAHFAGNHSLVVITPDTSGAWEAGLGAGRGRAVPVTPVYIQALSFDPRLPRLLPQNRHLPRTLPAYTLRNGDDIVERLRASGRLDPRGAGPRGSGGAVGVAL